MTSVVTSVSIRRDFAYEVLGDRALVPTKIVVKCAGAASKTIQVHPLALPFGLLERVKVYAPEGVKFSCTVELVKTTGRTKTEVLNETNAELCVVYGDSRDNQDGADEDLKTVKKLTGHVMTSRMIAAGSVVGVLIAFIDCDVPAEFFIDYIGANVVPVSETRELDRPKFTFSLPPLTARARMSRGLSEGSTKSAQEQEPANKP